jgi:arylsulfatase A-like enzyme
LRVPFIIRWPGRVPAARVSNEIVHEVNTYTTFAKIAGAPFPHDRPIDGADQSDFLLGKAEKSQLITDPVLTRPGRSAGGSDRQPVGSPAFS